MEQRSDGRFCGATLDPDRSLGPGSDERVLDVGLPSRISEQPSRPADHGVDGGDIEVCALGKREKPQRVGEHGPGSGLVVDLELDRHAFHSEIHFHLLAAPGRERESFGDEREATVEIVVADRAASAL